MPVGMLLIMPKFNTVSRIKSGDIIESNNSSGVIKFTYNKRNTKYLGDLVYCSRIK